VLVDNFVHADLHPGNIMYEPPVGGKSWGWLNGREAVLGFVDAGLVVELSTRDQRNFVLLFHAIAQGDGERAADLMLNNAPQVRGSRGIWPRRAEVQPRLASIGVGFLGRTHARFVFSRQSGSVHPNRARTRCKDTLP
jgi:hypothetical protein